METTQQISNDSFSLSWLSNTKHSLGFLEESLRRSFDGLDESSFIDMDPNFFSLRWTNSTDFDFSHPNCGDVAATPAASLVVHADQIFFNGHLLPLHLVNTLKSKDDSVSTNSSPSLNSSDFIAMRSCGKPLSRESTKSPVKMLMKYLNFLIPLYKKVRKMKKNSWKTPRSFDNSTGSPSRMSFERRRGSRVFDVASESPIQDAVLHCKKSIAKSD
ncbi:probable membrane-associated kinase regulator 6 [Phalaenopsis equestris]|uniref:probable membrane-associated kinase regulator 6 n=1 Tax=Phalaenopsis equestris TaxID=78828 RepID=UPI0009E1FA83|nr:probable membrane-associated kinase regulator 6 [Phalaenopsis equestris]